ncbi:TIGR04282 family arsenosugar biosynthesis glycosyltransferase [Motiliproteus sp.]|uniref:TIGR04282 family arsenosugar biosynthesis glycosyltransferase n=1 Tax=Motiliproteus sp. TaxID=1898955 RepID=UPI003BAB144E
MSLLHPGSSSEAVTPTLVLIFKRPKPGQGKQRLAADIGLWSACQLAEQFLNCALEDLRDWPGPVVLSPSMAEDREWAQQLLPEAEVMVQAEGNLGRRILALDQGLRARGHRSLIYIGSDAPMLKPIHFKTVAESLNKQSVVVCPAADGGVTIMANSQPWPAALEQLPWSTDRLGQSLAACCIEAGQTVAGVMSSYDIDHQSDLQRLRQDLAEDSRPQRRQLLALIEQVDRKDMATEDPAGSETGAASASGGDQRKQPILV